jgi:hypothetical protein
LTLFAAAIEQNGHSKFFKWNTDSIICFTSLEAGMNQVRAFRKSNVNNVVSLWVYDRDSGDWKQVPE